MSASLRTLRWRAAISIAGAVLVVGWVFATGRTSHIIQIDYNWAREFLDSSTVEIDGDSVGILQRYGRSQFITGFKVEPGEHVVRIVHDECEGVPERVTIESDGSRLEVLMADVDDGYSCRVVLR